MTSHEHQQHLWTLAARYSRRLTLAAICVVTGIGPIHSGSVDTLRPVQHTGLAASHLSNISAFFVENQGQLPSVVRNYIQGKRMSVFFTDESVVYSLSNPSVQVAGQHSADSPARWSVEARFKGSNQGVRAYGAQPTPTKISYFRGQPAAWKTGLPTYGAVRYDNLWDGIDLIYEIHPGEIKHSFLVHPGADPAQIQIEYRGASDIVTSRSGDLIVKTPIGQFADRSPVAFQHIDGSTSSVPTAFSVETSADKESWTCSFELASYDPRLPLVIDPVSIIFSGYIGSSERENGQDLALDNQGNIYIVGFTDSPTFPVLVGPDLTYNGGTNGDGFVAKIAADGSGLVYAGYIGGSEDDFVFGVTVDTSGRAHVTGTTKSDELTFPVLVGPDVTFNGNSDAFVAVVSQSGLTLDFCGYVGGDGHDEARQIDLDSQGNLVITGNTDSTEGSFPVTVGPDLTQNGGYDAFVASVDSLGTSLHFAGFIGGSEGDFGNGIYLDNSNSIYIAGHTESDENTFPVSVGPDLTFNGVRDCFVAKVQPDGSALDYAGYIGGDVDDLCWGTDVDPSGKQHVTGRAQSTEATFPVIVGPDLTHNGSADAFVARLNATATGLDWCGYIGGSGYENIGNNKGLDSQGNYYITGYTDSDQSTFPVKVGPDLFYNGGSRDGYLAMVSSDGTQLYYAGYIGGANRDVGSSLWVDELGTVWLVGSTDSDENSFPVLGGPDLTYNGGYEDVYITKFESYLWIFGDDFESGDTSAWSDTYPPEGHPVADFTFLTSDLTVQFVNHSEGDLPMTYVWDFDDGTPTSNVQHPQHTYATAGTYNVSLTAINAIGSDTDTQEVVVSP